MSEIVERATQVPKNTQFRPCSVSGETITTVNCSMTVVAGRTETLVEANPARARLIVKGVNPRASAGAAWIYPCDEDGRQGSHPINYPGLPSDDTVTIEGGNKVKIRAMSSTLSSTVVVYEVVHV